MTVWVKTQNQIFLISKFNPKLMEGYRKNVAMVVLNDKQDILICRRKGTENWQFPQGGIDENELIEDAIWMTRYSVEIANFIGQNLLFLKDLLKKKSI